MLANRRKCIRNALTKRVFKQSHHHTVCVEAAWIREHIVACGLDQVPRESFRPSQEDAKAMGLCFSGCG